MRGPSVISVSDYSSHEHVSPLLNFAKIFDIHNYRMIRLLFGEETMII